MIDFSLVEYPGAQECVERIVGNVFEHGIPLIQGGQLIEEPFFTRAALFEELLSINPWNRDPETIGKLQEKYLDLVGGLALLAVCETGKALQARGYDTPREQVSFSVGQQIVEDEATSTLLIMAQWEAIIARQPGDIRPANIRHIIREAKDVYGIFFACRYAQNGIGHVEESPGDIMTSSIAVALSGITARIDELR